MILRFFQKMQTMWTHWFVPVLLLLTLAARAETKNQKTIPIQWSITTLANVELRREYTVRTWTTSDGLPMNRIQSLLQTRDGFLWVGTQGGLARFDGHKFTVFNSANTAAFRKDSCLSLAEGLDGTLWVGTVDGVVYFRSNRFKHIALDYAHSDGRRVNGLCVTASGTVWAATGQGPGIIDQGTFLVDPNFDDFIHPHWKKPTRHVSAIQEDVNGNLFLIDSAGVQRRLRGHSDWERLGTFAPSEMFRAPDGTVWAADSHLYRLTNEGFVRQDTESRDFSNAIRAGATDHVGQVWVAAENRIYRFGRGFTRVPTSAELPGQIEALLLDREGNLWAGTTSGLACLTRQLFSSLTSAEGLVHDDAWSISEAPDGAVWVGTVGGVSRFHGNSIFNYVPHGERSLFPALPGTHTVMALRNGEVWTTPDGLLCRVYPNPPNFPKAADGRGIREKPCYEDTDGSIWMGQFGYLKRWHKEVLEDLFEPGTGVSSILRDKAGRLWIGTRGAGLVMVAGTTTNRFTTANGLTSDFCAPVLADDNGTVWIASDKGLNRWKDGHITQYTVENGLIEGFILNVLEDNFGWFWLNGHGGIYRVRKQQLNDFADGKISRVAAFAYVESDGLPSAEGNGGWLPNSCKTSDGKLWFPTTKGVAIVDPAELLTNVLTPTPLITGFIVGMETFFSDAVGLPNLKSTIQLAPGHGKIIRINYTAPAFAVNSRIGFEYQLEGQDSDWVSAKIDRFALYTNLRPGDYRFRVRCVIADGVASEPAILAFSLAPHFYQTFSFFTVCGFGLVGLAGAIHARRLFVQRRILRLEQQTALERERSRIAADIHDTLGADFSRIAMLAERLRQSNESGCSSADSIAQTVRQMGDSMSELIWATNASNDTLDNLISYLREHAATMCDTAGIKLHTDIPCLPPKFISGLLRHNIYLIFREALNNIVKHAGASQVRFRVGQVNDSLEMELADNGRGFSSGLRKGSGQTSIRKRAEEIKARIEVSSREGAGTSVLLRVTLPLQGSKSINAQGTSAPPRFGS